MKEQEGFKIENIINADRLRKEMGDIDGLAASIKEFGLIQPIVLAADWQLVAGGRRLRAVQKLGWTHLIHGRDYIWREELEGPELPIRLRAVELEENLRRKELTWQEQVEGKRRLLELMQSIHGMPKMGAPTRSERLSGTPSGFGVNKLASMLGESAGSTSQDLALAAAIKAVPILAKAATKVDANRQMIQLALTAIAASKGIDVKTPSFMPQKAMQYKIIIDCVDEQQQKNLFERFLMEGIPCRLLIS